jgi:hypothetical protein
MLRSSSGGTAARSLSAATRWPKRIRCSHGFRETCGITPTDAARLISGRFADPLLLGRRTSRRLPGVFSHLAIAGGVVYDALVALATVENGAALATRGNRARATYEIVGANVIAAAASSS